MASKSSSDDKPKVNTNPSGASDDQIKAGEQVGKVRGADVDGSFHVPEFTDPQTGEPVEWTPEVPESSVKAES